ncbi:MAG: hypothetical protein JXR91_12520 [Deltaproteobacteria bacterium]|nr:hypothetical protein [Deltaproteobacteria bacterium]
MTSEQIKVVTNASQLFEALNSVLNADKQFSGSMHWKNINGNEYLYRGYTGGKTHSLGVKNQKTEDIKNKFDAAKKEHQKNKMHLKEQMKIHGGYIRINKLNRFPTIGANVIRLFQSNEIPIKIIGTNALYAYEISSGVLFLPENIATDDLDFLLDSRQSLQIVSKLKKRTILSLLKEADTSFKKLTDSPYEFAVSNKNGFRIELVTQENSDLSNPNLFYNQLEAEDIKPQGTGSLKWLIASPKYKETVFDYQGNPLILDTVHPVAYAIHKYYIGNFERAKPAKRRKDLLQFKILGTLLNNEFGYLPIPESIKKLFPDSIVSKVNTGNKTN